MSEAKKPTVDPKAGTPSDPELSEEQLERVTGGAVDAFLKLEQTVDTTIGSATGNAALKSGQVTPI
jgi:hypothetical protein